MDSASGRYPCDAQDCDRSSCPAIQSNYDAQERKFKSAPAIQRADGTDAFRQREAKVYSGPYHITNQDLEKSQQQPSGQGQDHSHAQSGDGDQSQQHSDHHHPGKIFRILILAKGFLSFQICNTQGRRVFIDEIE